MSLVSKMSNGALPKIHPDTGSVSEYPSPITGTFPNLPPKLLTPLQRNQRAMLGRMKGRQLGNMALQPLMEGNALPSDSLGDGRNHSQPLSVKNYSINEEVDSGHRHFSLMHWLYPSLFSFPHMGLGSDKAQYKNLNMNSNIALVKAAKLTMAKKVAGMGGHTSWSARYSFLR